MNIDYTELFEKEITLAADEVNCLGPQLVLENCTIRSACDHDTLKIVGLQMSGGNFIQHKRLTNFQFDGAQFIDVKFSGNFIGCDFGDWETSDRSSVSGCDFSDAVLDACRFLNCDMQGILLPEWPCFTILHPWEARSVVLSRNWPRELGITLDVYTDNDPECVAACGNAEIHAKKNQISLDECRKLLMLLPGLKIRGQ